MRVRHPGAGDVGRRAVDRLVEAERPRAEARRRQQADGAGDHGRLVREHVAEEVLGDDDVEVGRPADELHGGVVDQHVLELHPGVGRGRADDLLSPEARRLEHVGLVDRGHLSPAAGGGAEAPLGQALDLGQGVGARVEGAVPLATPLAEVDAAGQLAHHQQVGPLDALAPQRARVVERRPGAHGPQVGVEAEPRAQPEQALLRARLGGVGCVPAGPAHRAQQHGVRTRAGLEHLVGEGGAVGVDGGAADQVLVPCDREPVVGRDRVDQLAGDRHDLGPDPVARQQGDRHLSHRRLLPAARGPRDPTSGGSGPGEGT